MWEFSFGTTANVESSNLIQLHEHGIISKDNLQEMVLCPHRELKRFTSLRKLVNSPSHSTSLISKRRPHLSNWRHLHRQLMLGRMGVFFKWVNNEVVNWCDSSYEAKKKWTKVTQMGEIPPFNQNPDSGLLSLSAIAKTSEGVAFALMEYQPTNNSANSTFWRYYTFSLGNSVQSTCWDDLSWKFHFPV